MIPTRDEIERWLVTMRDEIDRLTRENDELQRSVDDTGGKLAGMEIHGNSAEHWYLKATAYKDAYSVRDEAIAELKTARENEVAEGERADRNHDNLMKLRAEVDRLTEANANLTRQVEWEQRAWTMWMEKALGKPLEGRTPSMVQVQLTKRFDAIQADLDRANTEAALARDALAKANQDHVMAKVTREANEAQIREQWDRIRAVTRQIIEVTGAPGPCSMEDAVGFIVAEVGRLRADLEIALAKATTPAPEREVKIKTWEAWALEDAADSDLYDDCFVLERHEIEDAVALMRSAGDGKALLRELRGKYVAAGYGAKELSVRLVDEMLARPEPSTVYSRGKTIAESADPPTAYYPPPPVEIWPEEMKRQTLVGKFEPAPVERPAAAVPDHVPDAGKTVPDDTRELVAQLADLFKVHLSCNGGVNRQRSDRAAEIAARLRGSK